MLVIKDWTKKQELLEQSPPGRCPAVWGLVCHGKNAQHSTDSGGWWVTPDRFTLRSLNLRHSESRQQLAQQKQRVTCLVQKLSVKAGAKEPNYCVAGAITWRPELQGAVDSASITPGWVAVETICSNDEVPYFPIHFMRNGMNPQW